MPKLAVAPKSYTTRWDTIWSQVAGFRPSIAEAKRFMVLQAYIDDSSHDESGIYVLAGYLSSAERWAHFAKEWEERLPLAVIQPSGRYRFKMSEMAALNRMQNVSAFHTVINKYADLSIACILNKKDVYEASSRLEVAYVDAAGKHNILDVSQFVKNVANPFTVGFTHITNRLYSTCSTGMDGIDGVDGLKFSDPLDFYFDDTPEKHIIRKNWDYYIATAPDEIRSFVGAVPRFEDDEVFLPIQAADFRAWWAGLFNANYMMSKISL